MEDDASNPGTPCLHCGLPVPTARRRRGGESASFCCLGCHLVHGMITAGEEEGGGPRSHPMLLRLGAGIFLGMNIMAFSGFFYAQQVYDAAGHISVAGSVLASLFSHLLLLLCTLVLLLLGAPLLREAMESGEGRSDASPRRRLLPHLDVNLLILIGVLTAYGVSAYHTFTGQGHLYYDTAAMILVLVTLGGHLDARAKRRASLAGHALLASLPAMLQIRRGEEYVETPVDQAVVDDRVRIRPGDALAIDGVIEQGGGYVDESLLTGESRPRSVAVGDRVMAGAVNLDGMLIVRVTMPAGRRVIDHIRKLLDEARLRQPAIQRLADRLASLFIPFVIVLALMVFAWHGTHHGMEAGLMSALSVLLISCPCALGLAAPLATHHALSRAAAHGMLIDSPATLEKLAAVRRVLFDKTGTLTQGRMTVERTETSAGINEHDALQMAATLEAGAHHPIARAIIEQAKARGLETGRLLSSRVLPGLGVEGVIVMPGDDSPCSLRLGNAALVKQSGGCEHPNLPGDEPGSRVFLIKGAQVLARFTLTDVLRSESVQVLAELRGRCMQSLMLTGDQPAAAAVMAKRLDIDFAAGLLPADKVEHLQRLRRTMTTPVAFVGDGLNDAPVMGVADVGISVGNAVDLARQAGHVHLPGEGIARLPLLFDLAREAVRRIRFNLFWAFGYNAIGLALASCGLLTPIFAASSMIVSSLLIVMTSTRPFRCETVVESIDQPQTAVSSVTDASRRSLSPSLASS